MGFKPEDFAHIARRERRESEEAIEEARRQHEKTGIGGGLFTEQTMGSGDSYREELRIRFAIAALTGIIAAPGFWEENTFAAIAKDCWAMADACLEAQK